jgi:hypothetical protein
MMPNWSNFTLAQLRAATKTQIITAITNWLQTRTKRQIIELLIDVVSIADKPIITRSGDEQITQRDDVNRDVLGNVIGGKRTNYAYYPTNEINTITITDLDADLITVLGQRTIKHYTDGRQPEEV